MLKIKVVNKDGNELLITPASNSVSAIFNFEYQDGDWMIIDTDKLDGYYKIQLEDTMESTIVYAPGLFFTYQIPYKDKRSNYSPKSFYGNCHIIKVSEADDMDVYKRRNLAVNPYDNEDNNSFYPHSSANICTRGECTFASRNAIDGVYYNDSHGSYPYQSWGINRDPKAEFKIDFGREVIVDEIVLTLRADFPHDNYWQEAKLEFSDGTSMIIKLKKTGERQAFEFEPKKITSVVLKNLIKSKEKSEFPALTQFEVWGTDIKKE